MCVRVYGIAATYTANNARILEILAYSLNDFPSGINFMLTGSRSLEATNSYCLDDFDQLACMIDLLFL